MVKLSILAFAIGLIWSPSAAQTPEEGFSNFLYYAMREYPRWALQNGQEPSHYSPAINLTMHNGPVIFSGQIKNQIFYGLSNYNEFYLTSDLSMGSFLIRVDIRENFYIKGEYEVEGMAFSTPVQGLGHFDSTPTSRTNAGFHRLRFEGLKVIDNHFVLSDDIPTVASAGWSELELDFDQLEAGGYAETMRILLQGEHFNHRFFLLNEIAGDNYKKYFEHLFKENTYSEIIEWD